jgi:hypothetical protein
MGVRLIAPEVFNCSLKLTDVVSSVDVVSPASQQRGVINQYMSLHVACAAQASVTYVQASNSCRSISVACMLPRPVQSEPAADLHFRKNEQF